MSVIHINQIKTRITKLFEGKIDLHDLKPDNINRDSHFLSRALAAYAIHHLAKADIEVAAAAITDAGDDNGIDAIHYDEPEKRLYIVQSKWIHDGRGEPDNGAVKKFVAGVRDLFNASFDRFNGKVKSKKAIIEAALNDANSQYTLVLVYTGINTLALPSQRDFKDLEEEMNDASEVLNVRSINQSELHSSLSSPLVGQPIDIDVSLANWGKIENPYRGFYGQVSATEIAEWWKTSGDSLFAKNLRNVLGDTDVNAEIRSTLTTEPERFWYYNNGITMVAGKVAKTMMGGAEREFGAFRCSDVNVVNGAQTVSTIGRFAATGGNLEKVKVGLRIISLENCPPDFGGQVTRTNNRQNRIENRDFVSQDPVQITIKRELALDGIEYNLMRSDSFTPLEKSFDLVEATTALACASSKPDLVVQLKREIGKLWEDLQKAPYKQLFNPSTESSYVWQCVRVQRIIDGRLEEIVKSCYEGGGRRYGSAVHGNRMIAALVFRRLDLLNAELDPASDKSTICAKTDEAHKRLENELVNWFPNAILPTLFKNASKCTNLFDECINDTPFAFVLHPVDRPV